MKEKIKLKAALISLGSVSSKLTIEAMKKYFYEVDDINISKIEINLLGTCKGENKCVYYENKKLSGYDCIYTKGSFRYANLQRALTQIFSENSYIPASPESFTIANDKILTHLSLLKHNIPMPKTYLVSSLKAAKELLNKVNYPIIMKFPHGTQGKGVMVAESKDSASSMIDALSALRQPFLIQEYIPTNGVDIRVFVVGEKVIASMKRKAVEGSSRSNIHAGGKGIPCQIDEKTRNIALKAAKALNLAICGVDILESNKGPLVLEVNCSPGLQGIMETTKIDVADHIAKFLYNQTLKKHLKEKYKSSERVIKDMGLAAKETQEIITSLDFRGKRILLPELISKISNFSETDHAVIKVKNKEIKIELFK